MNMGVADSVDLGWKIAVVLDGWGGEALLDSYEVERRPANEYVLDESEANLAASPNALFRPGLEDDTLDGEAMRREVERIVVEAKTAEFYALGVVLGYCNRDSPVIVDDGTACAATRSRDYTPSATPGCLAPHRWLGDTSLYDLFGQGFTLLVLDAGMDVGAAEAEAGATVTPLKVLRLDDPALLALYEAPLALIRPDQHVAWRGTAWRAGEALLERVTGR